MTLISDYRTSLYNEITQIHTYDKQTADYQTIKNSRKILTMWDTGTIKLGISKPCLEVTHHK